jgi:sirohydrochlorin cobaltochelatase
MEMPQGLVLFGHGSRDPLWRLPMDAVAARLASRAPAIRVVCAFLEFGEPDLAGAMKQLVAQGIRQVRVVPMFLGAGKHVREDLPALVDRLRTTYPDCGLILQSPVGDDARLIESLAEICLHGTAIS